MLIYQDSDLNCSESKIVNHYLKLYTYMKGVSYMNKRNTYFILSYCFIAFNFMFVNIIPFHDNFISYFRNPEEINNQ